MDTKKTLYHTLQENPDAWLQAAVDAKEISDLERDTIQKFLDAPNKAEAARQMDIIRATMQDRPEFALSQEERAEIAQQVEELDLSIMPTTGKGSNFFDEDEAGEFYGDGDFNTDDLDLEGFEFSDGGDY